MPGSAAFWNAVQPASLRDSLRVCATWHYWNPAVKGVRTLALADAEVKVFAGDGNWFVVATALECARCVGKPIREDSFARCRQVCLELVWRGLRDEMSIGGLLLRDVLKAATGLQTRVYLEKTHAPSMGVKSRGSFLGSKFGLISLRYR